MTTKQENHERIQTFVDERKDLWQKRLRLEHIDIEHVFLDSYFVGPSDDFVVSATTEGRWNYMQAKIKWYLPSIGRHSDHRLEEILVHELVHVLLMPEQNLLDYKLAEKQTKEAMDEGEANSLMAMYYDLLEMSTENVTQTLIRAWGAAVPGTGLDEST